MKNGFLKALLGENLELNTGGKQRIIRELKIKNISSYNIKTALKEIDEELYVETIEKIAASKNNTIKESNLFKKKKKISILFTEKDMNPL